MTLPTRTDWTEAFIRELTRFVAAGKPDVDPRRVHNGLLCGCYDVRVALAEPHHEDRVRIVVIYDRIAPPVEVTFHGTEFDANLADEPRSVALRVTRWLLPRLLRPAA